MVRNLEIIGEASRNIPVKIQNKYTEVPWKKMIKLRNILIHEYFGVDESIIWEIIKTDFPAIRPLIMKVIQKEESIK